MKRKQSYKRKTVTLVATFFGVVVLAGFMGMTLFKKDAVTPVGSKQTATVATTEVLGAKTEVSGYAFSVSKKLIITNDAKLGSDKKRVILTTEIKNDDTKTLQFSPLLQVTLLDENGVAYPVTTEFLVAGRTIGGPIEAGKKVSVELDFVLPASKAATKVRFVAEQGSAPQDIAL